MTLLLKQEKQEMVNAVIAALPRGGYKDKIATRAVELAVERLPPQAQWLWRNGHRGLVVTKGIYWYHEKDRHWGSLAAATVPGYEDVHEMIRADELIVAWVEALGKEREQADKLQQQLSAAMLGIRTVEEFKKAFPDLVSYLPAKAAAVANLPVATELNAALVAAGLPVPKEVDKAEENV